MFLCFFMFGCGDSVRKFLWETDCWCWETEACQETASCARHVCSACFSDVYHAGCHLPRFEIVRVLLAFRVAMYRTAAVETGDGWFCRMDACLLSTCSFSVQMLIRSPPFCRDQEELGPRSSKLHRLVWRYWQANVFSCGKVWSKFVDV